MSIEKSTFRLAMMGLCCASLFGAGCNKQGETSVKADEPAKETVAAPVVAPAPKPPADPGKVLITVGDKKLTEGDLAKQADESYEQVASMVPPEQADGYRTQMRVQAAQSFIISTLLENEAAKRNVTVTDEDVEKAIADITKRLPPEMTLEKVLEMEDLTPATFRERLKKDLRVKKLFDEEMEKGGAVSEQEAKDFYAKQKSAFEAPEQVTAQHILLKVDEKDDEAAKKAKKEKIEGLRKQIVEGGADFAKLAKENSDCPSGKEGGMLGQFGRGQMVPQFEEAAFTQATNVVGPVIETQFGFHIVKVLDRTEGHTKSFEDVKAQIIDYLKMMKSRKIIPPFLDKLRADGKVEVDPKLQAEIDEAKSAEQSRQAMMQQMEMQEGGEEGEAGDAEEAPIAVPAPVPAPPAPVPAPPAPAPAP